MGIPRIQRLRPHPTPSLTVPEQTPTRLLTPKEAARFLSISERTLSRIVKRGELPVIHVASSLRYVCIVAGHQGDALGRVGAWRKHQDKVQHSQRVYIPTNMVPPTCHHLCLFLYSPYPMRPTGNGFHMLRH